MRSVEVAWDQAAGRFEASGKWTGHTIAINAPAGPDEQRGPTGFSAADLILAGVGACSAWDVVEILRKSRQQVSGLSVRVDGRQEEAPPWTFRRVTIRFTIHGTGLDREAVARAIRLSVDRYCSVIATVRGSAEVVDSFEIVEAEPGEDTSGDLAADPA
jgi:putative redox protein